MNSSKRIFVIAWTVVLMGTASPLWAKARKADFNGDGIADLAIGVPYERVAGFDAAGGVHVIYGKNNVGLKAAGDQFWTQDSPGINGIPASMDLFGGALAVGDFDDDGFDDLAIGCYADEINGVDGAGSVAVLYGSSSGLRANGDQLWHRDVTSILGDLQANALFGFTLAVGDFNGDSHDDLAISVRQQNVNGQNGAGEVHVLYGGASGLSASGDQIFNQDTTGLDGDPEISDLFGHALAAGDFNNDGRDDLAIGIPGDAAGGIGGAGGVQVLYGSPAGLDPNDSQLVNEDVGNIDGVPENGDGFGSSLAVGDFDGNGKDDLAIGAIAENIGGVDAGAVYVLYGSANGLRTDNPDFWNQDIPGIADSAENGDFFGWALAVGDFDNDNRDDLAISVVGEDLNGHGNAGAVHVLYGTNSGLSASNDQFWTQDSAGIPDKVEDDDEFGIALTAGDYDNDGRDDLAIGVPYETFGGLGVAGIVHVIYGRNANGLKSVGNQLWNQNSDGIADAATAGEYFGGALR